MLNGSCARNGHLSADIRRGVSVGEVRLDERRLVKRMLEGEERAFDQFFGDPEAAPEPDDDEAY